MKQHEIETGKTYLAKVNNKMAKVRIDDVSPYGGWNATNIATGKKIRIRSPQRLRAEVGQMPKYKVRTTPEPFPESDIARPEAAIDAAQAPSMVPAKPKMAQAMSGLDAAAKVLADAGTPLNAKQIVERILAQRLWTTEGKTPHATMHASISREIKLKGDAARFRKAERGLFTTAG